MKSFHISVPQPDELPEREREDAMGAYLMMFAAVAVALPLPIINLVAAVVYHIVNRRKSRFIHFHSLQSLVAQIPITLLNWCLLGWGIQIWWMKSIELGQMFWIYLGIVVSMNLLYFTFSIVAAVYARKGKLYRFFLIGSWCESRIFHRTDEMNYNRGY